MTLFCHNSTVDHGQVAVNPLEPRFDPGAGETGQWIDPSQSVKPYYVTTDHGQVLVDPLEPRFDSGAGETGQWVDPLAPPPGFNPLG